MLNPRETALLVIDMQNDFAEKGALLEVKGIRRNISSFKAFIDFCRKKKVLIVYTRHCYDPLKNPIEATLFRSLKKNGLRKGMYGWEIFPFLSPEKNDIILNKTRYDAFFKTSLHRILKKNGIKNVIITGTMTEVCCESTARTAMFNDYHVFFCDSFTYTSRSPVHKKTLSLIESHFGTVVTAQHLTHLFA
ncbi:MAG: isochorismatase family cysteine hydrolase [Nanoarchaeota archaeon]